jgi:ferrous iron transport protein A
MNNSDPTVKTSSLDAIPHDVETRVVRIGGVGAIARRLMEMGVVPGAPIRIVRTAPLGDPIVVSIRDYYLALRQAEAQMITVATNAG